MRIYKINEGSYCCEITNNETKIAGINKCLLKQYHFAYTDYICLCDLCVYHQLAYPISEPLVPTLLSETPLLGLVLDSDKRVESSGSRAGNTDLENKYIG